MSLLRLLGHLAGRLPAAVGLALAGCLAGIGSSLDSPQLGQQAGGAGQGQAGGADSQRTVAANHLPPLSPCATQAPAPRVLRRLTGPEYRASLEDLLGSDGAEATPAGLFAQEPTTYGFDNMQANLVITRNNLQDVATAAEAWGAWAGAHPERVGSCQATSSSCLEATARAWLGRLFRRPAEAQEVADYAGIMGTATSFAQAADFLVAASLQSPHFLYRSELGVADRDGRYALTPYEVATELSYLITGSTPDDLLLAQAAANALVAPAQLAAQAERLWQLPRARQVVGRFLTQWLGLADLARQAHTERDGTSLSDPLKAAMLAEAQGLVQQVAFAEGASYPDLLTTPAPAPQGPLVAFYGPGERLPGVLGLGGWLASASSAIEASPVLRGRALRMRFLCQSIGSPPSNVPSVSTDTAGAKTLRQRFSAHLSQPACSGCHQLMDPLAYPLGNFDGLGRRRPGDLEGGVPVDTTGLVAAPLEGDQVPLADAQALVAYLAHSHQAADCLSRHLTMYALGQLMWEEDACTFAAAAAYAAEQRYLVKAAFVGVTQTLSFTRRVPDP